MAGVSRPFAANSRASRAPLLLLAPMNFDDALKHYAPRAWFRFKFLKYKHFKRGEPEIHLIRHLVQPGTTAIDIGCSIGFYAAEMARSAGKVIAFEANPAVAQFARTVAPRNVEVINVALSSAPGRATLRMPRSPKGDTVDELATIEAGSTTHASNTASIDVELKRLDDFSIANCSFIKIDVEGHEEAVLDGAARLITSQRPVLMIELDESLNQGALARLREHYAALGYRGFFLSHGTLRPISEFDPARHQNAENLKPRHKLPRGAEYINNFVFVSEEKSARVLARP
jgi:FkbM family methyltransferase